MSQFDIPRRVMGTEIELGFEGAYPIEEEFHDNGSRIYRDRPITPYYASYDHIEVASPETSNAYDALVWEEASIQRLVREGYATGIVKNNEDHYGATWGSHENYFVFFPASKNTLLVPHLITRILFTGSGSISMLGGFEISQRAKHIEQVTGLGTTTMRPIIELRDEKLADTNYGRRLHLILGDSNRCEVANFLKLGTTALIIDMIEDHCLPTIPYDLEHAVRDLHAISENPLEHVLSGSGKHKLTALDVQGLYQQQANRMYRGRDRVTDHVLDYWGLTLGELATQPDNLFGWVDWITKQWLIERSGVRSYNDDEARSIDINYHVIDSDNLFDELKKDGFIRKVAAEEHIVRAVDNPPFDTRAYARGHAIHYAQKLPESVNPLLCVDWKTFSLQIGNANFFDMPLEDPRIPYRRRLNQLLRKLARLR